MQNHYNINVGTKLQTEVFEMPVERFSQTLVIQFIKQTRMLRAFANISESSEMRDFLGL